MTHYTRVNAAAIMRGKRPAVGIPTILGITKASLETENSLLYELTQFLPRYLCRRGHTLTASTWMST